MSFPINAANRLTNTDLEIFLEQVQHQRRIPGPIPPLRPSPPSPRPTGQEPLGSKVVWSRRSSAGGTDLKESRGHQDDEAVRN